MGIIADVMTALGYVLVYVLLVKLSFLFWYAYDVHLNREKDICFGFRFLTSIALVAIPIVIVRVVVDLASDFEDFLREIYAKKVNKKVRI